MGRQRTPRREVNNSFQIPDWDFYDCISVCYQKIITKSLRIQNYGVKMWDEEGKLCVEADGCPQK